MKKINFFVLNPDIFCLPDNLATIIYDFTLDNKSRFEDILLTPGQQYTAQVQFENPENDESLFLYQCSISS